MIAQLSIMKSTNMFGEVDPILIIIAFVVAFGFTIYQYFTSKSSSDRPKSQRLKPNKANKDMAFEKLEEHSGEFDNPEIVTLVNGKIHVAIGNFELLMKTQLKDSLNYLALSLGFGLANCILIEGPNSCVILDAMECHEAANDVLEAFKKVIKDKPIEAIILTHFHADHTYGIDVFTNAFPEAKIYSHESLRGYFQQLLNVRSQITQKRAVFQFGTELGRGEHENSGIGLKLRYFTS